MKGPLDGVRVLDLGHDWACPHTGRVLADFGAEVVKIEYPRRLDGMRGGYTKDGAHNRHPRFWQLHRNKRSITLDLKRPQDLAAFEDLVRTADVLIDNARVGVLERLGVGHERLLELRPELIVVAMTAFGLTGPWASYAGYGATMEALGGIQALTAYGRDERPHRIREMDVTNGILGVCAVMTALERRRATGRGGVVDLSELEAATHGLIGEHVVEFLATGSTTLPVGNRRPDMAPHGCFRCRGEDAWVVIAVRDDDDWRRLVQAAGFSDWSGDSGLSTLAGRQARHDEIDERIAAWTARLTDDDVMRLLQDAGVPAGAVLDASRLVADPHLEARGWFREAAEDGTRLPGLPFRLSGGDAGVRHRGPDLGRDNESLRRELGRPLDEIERLADRELGTAFDPE